MAQPFLEVEGLQKSFGGLRAINDVQFFRMDQKEVLGLIGPNGAGKTIAPALDHGHIETRYGQHPVQGQGDRRARRPGISSIWASPAPSRTCGPSTPADHCQRHGLLSLPPVHEDAGEWVKRIEAKAMDALEFAGISDMALEKASTLVTGGSQATGGGTGHCHGARAAAAGRALRRTQSRLKRTSWPNPSRDSTRAAVSAGCTARGRP